MDINASTLESSQTNYNSRWLHDSLLSHIELVVTFVRFFKSPFPYALLTTFATWCLSYTGMWLTRYLCTSLWGDEDILLPPVCSLVLNLFIVQPLLSVLVQLWDFELRGSSSLIWYLRKVLILELCLCVKRLSKLILNLFFYNVNF